eukprot:gene24-614_t
MAIEKDKLKEELSNIIKRIQTFKNDSWVTNLSKLSNELRKSLHKDKPFKSLGHGAKLIDFLKHEFKITEHGSEHFIVDQSSLLGEKYEVEQGNLCQEGALANQGDLPSRPNDASPPPLCDHKKNAPENEKNATTDSTQASPPSREMPRKETLFPVPMEPRKRFIMLVILMYNCGFEGLRGLFIKKHPHWRNSKKDIENFKRGSLHLEHFEKEPFNSGNIYTWDVSLLSKVLLKSDSRNMLNEEEIHAVECLRDIKNKLISHCSNIEVSEKEFEDYMSSALHSLMTIGVSEERLTVALNDSELSEDNLHYKMYRDELDGIKHSVKVLKEEVDANTRNIQALVNAIKNREIPQNKIPEQAQKHDPANWNLWLKVKKELNNFDDENNHYLLIVDKITSSDAQYLTALGKIPWKLVLDLDPDSDDNGLFRHISPHHENSGVIVTHTPSQLKHIDFKSIDLKRVNWVFANGRNKDADEDAPKSDHTDWRKYFKIPIFNMIKQFKKKLERRKPTFCIILNIGDSSRKVAMSLAQEIDEQFFSEESTFKNVLFSSNIDTRDFINPFFHSVLSTKFLFFGIHAIVGSQNKVYTLPTSQEDAPSPLENKKFHFLSEYFEILYKGCQNIPTNLSDEEKRKFENDHLKSFLKGNLISFESLSYSHDCQRTITKSIATRIRKILKNSRLNFEKFSLEL